MISLDAALRRLGMAAKIDCTTCRKRPKKKQRNK
jgi:hypothetical protein